VRVQGSASSLSSGDTSRHIIYCSINTSGLSQWAWAWAQALVDGVVTKNPIGYFLFGRTNRKIRPVKLSGLHVSQIFPAWLCKQKINF